MASSKKKKPKRQTEKKRRSRPELADPSFLECRRIMEMNGGFIHGRKL